MFFSNLALRVSHSTIRASSLQQIKVICSIRYLFLLMFIIGFKFGSFIGNLPSRRSISTNSDPDYSSTLKISGAKGGEQFMDAGFCDDFSMDEVDLSIEKYEVLFGIGNNDPENLFAQDEIDSLFGTKETSVAESICQGGYAAKESSTGDGNTVQPACSNAASGDSLRSCKTEPNVCYGKQPSNISFSSLTGDTNAGDCQDCGASSSILMRGEPPWCTPAHDSTTPSGIRTDAVLRYKEKKKTRKIEKTVRYATRRYGSHS